MGTRSVAAIVDAVTKHLKTLEGLEVLYVAVSTRGDLVDMDGSDSIPDHGAVLSCAVRYGGARLIDNVDLL